MSALNSEDRFDTAKAWQNQALGEWSSGRDVGLSLAAISLEHLLKAVLCSLHPALVVDATKFDALLGALDLDHLSKNPGVRKKTISAAQAWERVRQVHIFDADVPGIERLIEVSTGAVHLGELSGELSRRMFAQFLRVTVELRRVFYGERDECLIWGEWKDRVDTWLAEDGLRPAIEP